MSIARLKPICLAIGLAAAGCAQPGPVAPAASVPPPAPTVTVGQEVGAAARNQIVVQFASGSDRLMQDSNKQLDLAVRLFRDVRPVSMFSVGYSDAVGNEYDNLILSARRARAVKVALVSRGIPADQVLLRAFGQSDPVSKTDPTAAENRRVVVTWDIM